MEYNHFTINERESILSFLALGFSQAEMARQLNKNRSSIKREIDRNTINGKYSPSLAQSMYSDRKTKCGAKNILECDKALNSEIKKSI